MNLSSTQLRIIILAVAISSILEEISQIAVLSVHIGDAHIFFQSL